MITNDYEILEQPIISEEETTMNGKNTIDLEAYDGFKQATIQQIPLIKQVI